MKYIKKTSKNIESNFLEELLYDRGIITSENKEKFLQPTIENELSPMLLDNIVEAADLLEYHLKNGSKIYLIVDSDVDGFVSSSALYNYIMENYKQIYPNFKIKCHIPSGKEHGLETLMKDLSIEKKYDLILLPDAGSNDVEEHKILHEMGYDIICLDHHLVTKISKDAIIVNNQSSEKYDNKSLCGAGVVYKFLEVLDNRNGWKSAQKYLDIVSLGLVADVMNLTTLENRWLCSCGLSHISNSFF